MRGENLNPDLKSQHIANIKDLSSALAPRCHELRDSLQEELIRQEKEKAGEHGRLWGVFDAFKKEISHALDAKEFADAFAQTLGYGLFLARLNMQENDRQHLTLDNAKTYIPSGFDLIQELVNFLDELKSPEYLLAKQSIDEILSIMNSLNVAAIRQDLSFNKPQEKLFNPLQEERVLFAKDPYIYFYEDFLKAYDPSTRKGRGVYYTPPPVVNFIIRTINDILRDTFGIPQGFADRKKVTVLDFATGTGTFLLEVLQQVFDSVDEGIREGTIEHVLENIYGFEYLIAPYTVAHLKISQFLRDKGCKLKKRLQVYLTNTLEPNKPQTNFFLPALSKEVKEAQAIKDKPILVITGNPPYSGHSKNTGEWISDLIETYKYVDGKPLGEKNPKWLQDDYVKFIRFAQWKMEKEEEGIIGIITNHSFLDNPTFRGMRQSLMQSFNYIYIIDLHGNNKKKETTPNGGKDENVFDIEQGVSITFMVKKKNLDRSIFHAGLYGKRKEKYVQLLEDSIHTIDWKKLTPSTPFYLFVPQDETIRPEYEEGWMVTDIFLMNSVGIVTSDDATLVGFTEEDLNKQITDKYGKYDRGFTKSISYRPFDTRQVYYDKSKIERTRANVMQHMLDEKSIGLSIGRQYAAIGGDKYDIVSITNLIIELNYFRRGGNNLFPLYLCQTQSEQSSLLDIATTARKPNLNMAIVKQIAAKLSLPFIPDHAGKAEGDTSRFSPLDLLDYIYAVLHSPAYREKYKEFLKIDFPRIPYPENAATFWQLARLGSELRLLHLMESPLLSKLITKFPANGDNIVDKPNFKDGRVTINSEQYFEGVPATAWNFYIGGYQPAQKWLKDRKGRELSFDDIMHWQKIIVALFETDRLMKEIDQIEADWSVPKRHY